VPFAAGWGCAAPRRQEAEAQADRAAKLFLCGDVMTGRGIDQILERPSAPAIYEGYVKSALDYVRFAEERNGEIPRGAGPAYIWGDALEELGQAQPDVRIINLETSITTSGAAEPKGINYRMHPANAGCLAAAGIDCCVLANNHVMDWGRAGLEETLRVLEEARIPAAGAGRNLSEAQRPAALALRGGGRALVYGMGGADCGIPAHWAAEEQRSGVAYLPDYSVRTADRLAERTGAERRAGDIVIVSVHWGGNWGYSVPQEHRAFARRLVDAGAADLVHGHSSHHAKGVELYRNRLILYGCGDFLNDYEGIEGYEAFRGDLALMYFPALAAGGELAGLDIVCLQVRRFRLQRASEEDREWVRQMLNRESRTPGARFVVQGDGRLRLA
jgi:poly-gamma-glutamate synthesis protein (capsule biosynthesis protein)